MNTSILSPNAYVWTYAALVGECLHWVLRTQSLLSLSLRLSLYQQEPIVIALLCPIICTASKLLQVARRPCALVTQEHHASH